MTEHDTQTTLVTSIEESTGKTAIAIALAQHLAEGGESVGYMKPKGTRLESHVGKTLDSDPLLAREMLGTDDAVNDLEPVVYSPTFVEEAIRGREDPEELRERVLEAYGRIAEGRDHVVLEGGGSVTTGGVVELTDADVAEALDARAILVAGYDHPGDLDSVLAAAEDLGDSLAGVVFNAVSDAALDGLVSDAVPFLEGRGIEVFGVLPHERSLAGVTVAELADELGAETLTDGVDEAYVERFAVGAMSAESALQHLRRMKDVAVITGGDRSEIHTAALEAPGVRCLILTGGHRPSGAVIGKAESKGVPILLVQGDTLSAVERAENVVRSGRTRDREAVERMGELLAEHADLDAILG
jgi:BioD-like phosphotransacetylase family protein